MRCMNCHLSDLVSPASGHVAYLECPSCGAMELTYVPQDRPGYQADFHSTPVNYEVNPKTKQMEPAPQIIGVFGGYGSAKSRASLEEMLLRCLENPGGTGLFCAPTLQQLKRTTLKTWFQEVCPPPLIESFNKSEMEIKMVNGFTWYVVPTDDEEKLRSINAGLIHMEEASGIKRSIYDQLLTRMRDPFVNVKTMIVCSNPDLGWIREVIVSNDARKEPNHPEHDDFNRFITCYIWPTEWNEYLPANFIEMNSKGKPEWWIKRFMLGSFDHSEGMIYPNVTTCFTTSAEYGDIPKDWFKFVTLDHGLRNPTAVLFSAINPHKWEIVTYQEYYVAGRVVPEHAKHLKPMIQEIPSGRLQFMVGDPSIRNRNDPVNGKSVLALYGEYELYFTPGNNDVEAGILRVNSYIERSKWKILTDKCPNLAKEIIGYKFPELSMDDDKNPDEKPVKNNDHACDSIRYGFMRLPDDPELLWTLSYDPPQQYQSSSKRWDDDDEDDEENYTGNYLSYV